MAKQQNNKNNSGEKNANPQPAPQNTNNTNTTTPSAPASNQNSAPQQNYKPYQVGEKNKAPLIIMVAISAVVIAAIAGFAIYTLLFSPSALAKKAANEFMDAASKGDTAALIKAANETTADGKQFLEQVADRLTGKYSLVDSASKDGKYYYVYKLTGAKKNFVRFIVEKQDTGWEVSSVVYGDHRLSTIPGDTSEPTETSSKPRNTTPSAPAKDRMESKPTLGCLTQNDYRWFYHDKHTPTVTFDNTYNPGKFTNNATASVFFKPDSIVEDSLSSVYDDWADFASRNSDKQWQFVLKGSVYLAGGSTYANPASVDFADRRTNEVKRELISRGVPASRIRIATPVEHQSEYISDGSSSTIYRRVNVIVDPTCESTVQQPQTSNNL